MVSWLRDFVDVTVSPEELGETLTLRGFELSSIEKAPGAFFENASEKGSRSLFDDAVLDFEVTANRPDALSVIGLAREVGTAYSLPVRPLVPKPLTSTPTTDVVVKLEAPDLCPRYAAAVADVNIAPSPAWLAARLQAAGVRPINNVVDVTNYVLLELGQPMHAFDLETLAGREIRIRRAAPGERITTLDGVDRALDPEMLVIADRDKAQAVAGVMGGGRSEVSDRTKAIVLESAFFDPKSVRRTSKKLGLKTEASSRFERGADVNAAVKGIERAVMLLEEIGAGTARGGAIDEYPAPVALRNIELRRARIERMLGLEIGDPDVERILQGLGFQIRRNDAGWDAGVPTFRVDVLREVDLIEEVARHFGYDRLPSTFPALSAPPAASDPAIERDRLVRRVLLAAGCSEALTFSFIDAAAAAPFADERAIVPIANPLSAQFSVLRPSLLPGLLASVAHNRHRERTDVRLFELGAIMTRSGESRHVAVALTGGGTAHWSAGHRPVDFFDAKGMVEAVAHALEVELTFDAAAHPSYLVRGRAATISVDGRAIGSVGVLASTIVASAGLSMSEDVYVAELDLDALSASRSTAPLTVKPLPRYPSSARDISIVVDETLPAETVRGTIRAAAPDTLVSVREFDRYQGKGVPEGRVSLSLRLTFRSLARTLTDVEVETAMKEILTALKNAHDAVQR
ncbi:MAG TPA: phenylalanine--tRNA ligase subunit beta [Vicinamibacterales bacterium]